MKTSIDCVGLILVPDSKNIYTIILKIREISKKVNFVMWCNKYIMVYIL